MNDAHLHIAVNHFPIIGTIFGLGILVIGMILKNNSVKNTAYFVFIASAIFALVSVETGGGAVQVVKNLPNVTKEIIHQHHEWAEKLAFVLYITGFFSLVSLYFSMKNNRYLKYASVLTLLFALVAVYLAKETATAGGDIRHIETRKGFVPPSDKISDGDDDLEHDH